MNERAVEIRADEPLKRVLIVGLLFGLLTAGCAAVKPPPVAPAPTASRQTGAEAAAPLAQPVTPITRPAPAATQSEVSTTTASAAQAKPSASQRNTKAITPAAKAAPPAPSTQATKKDSTPPEVAKQKVPPLDVASLETRLKETKAIGVLTKIALKNQIDDLLSDFRAFYQGRLKTTLADLRQSYDLLVLKVLALLQDSDPPLASAIVASREAMWGILSDPAKFATI